MSPAEPIADQATTRLAELGVRAEQLRQTDQWQRYLAVAARFHRYSVQNQILIWWQRPDATQVAGYNAWRNLGRQVRKGEKGIRILAPIKRNVRDGDDDTTTKIVGFKVVSVFDYAQTEGDELPALVWPVVLDGAELLEDMVRMTCASEGLDVRFVNPAANPRPGARGWYSPTEGTINLVTPASLATFLHELAHHFDPEVTGDGPLQSKELVAESAAWLAAQQMGVELVVEVEHYLASWQATGELLVAVAKRAGFAARRIVSIYETITNEEEVA